MQQAGHRLRYEVSGHLVAWGVSCQDSRHATLHVCVVWLAGWLAGWLADWLALMKRLSNVATN